MTTPTEVLRIANKERGYSRWNDRQRGTKYARETQPELWPQDKWLLANGIAYCDIFVTWCFWKAGALGILPGGASYNTDHRASAGRRAGALVPLSQARPGDVLVFDWNRKTAATNHVGIFECFTPRGQVQAIEGNTSPGSKGSQSNGGGVYRRTRNPQTVRYVIRPQWKKVAASAPAKTNRAPAFPLPRKGKGANFYYGPANGPITSVSGRGHNSHVSHDVTKDANGRYRSIGLYMWQKQMKARGWNLKVDGRYGTETERVVRQFQKNKGLGVDGKIGPGTWCAAWELPVT